jgi:HSP20 family protein
MNSSRLLPSLWANFDRLQGEVGRLFEPWVDLPRVAAASAVPPVNVWEDADAFHLEAELPGLTQEQVHVAVTNRNQVTLSGERLSQDENKGRWHRRERGFGRFQRVLRLPLPVDADKVEARLEDGLLRVTLPKSEEAKPRKISVKAEA